MRLEKAVEGAVCDGCDGRKQRGGRGPSDGEREYEGPDSMSGSLNVISRNLAESFGKLTDKTFLLK